MTYLPPFGAFLGEFSEHYVLLRVLLLVLLPADLYEVGVSRHPPPGLSVSLSYSRHLFGLQNKRFYQKHASFHVARRRVGDCQENNLFRSRYIGLPAIKLTRIIKQ